MRTILLAGAASLVAWTGMQAQRATLRAFEPAWSIWGGVETFGVRITDPGDVDYRYKSSIAVGARYDHPLTRRTGLLLDAGIVPLSRQERHDPNSVAIGASVLSFFGDATLAGRFKPAAPVFFLLGGGVAVWNHMPTANDEGSAVEPRIAYGVGYDGARRGRTSLRWVYVGHLTKPGSTDAPFSTTKSLTHDWSFEFGVRVLTHDPGNAR